MPLSYADRVYIKQQDPNLQEGFLNCIRSYYNLQDNGLCSNNDD